MEEKYKKYNNGLATLLQNFTGRIRSIDSIQNLYGWERYELFTLQRNLLTQRYATDGIFRNIMTMEVNDALRSTPKISSKQLSLDDIAILEEYISENEIIDTLKHFFIFNNLYGGSGLIIDVLGHNFEDFFSANMLKKGDRVKFYAVDRWELSSNTLNDADQTLASQHWGEYYYYGRKINPDRILTLKGIAAPSYLGLELQGWGLSLAEPLVTPSSLYETGIRVLYELLSEAKIDVMHLDGLNQILSSSRAKQMEDRLMLVADLKNVTSMLALDSKDNFEQKQISFAGVADVIRELKYEICSAVDLPVSKIWGVQASGFSSGNEDIIKYNAKVMSDLRPRCILMLKKVLKIICGSLFGFAPLDLSIELDDLTLLTQEQIELKKQNEFLRLKTLYDSRLLSSQELGQALDSGGILKMDSKMVRGELPEMSAIPEGVEEIDLPGSSGFDL
jgi:phage-related protein (TIGR01555 family)